MAEIGTTLAHIDGGVPNLKISIPKIDEHKEFHNDLIMKLNNISIQSFNDDQFVFAFKKLIYGVIGHIINHDKDYFRFAQRKQDGLYAGSPKGCNQAL